jgi:RimJ/RimL family protein N-acetyltransferase
MNASGVSYQVVSPADQDAYKQFMTDLFDEELETLPDRLATVSDQQWAEFIKRRAGEHSVLYVARHEGRLVGGGGVGRIEQPSREHTVGLALNVAREYRGQGIGRALLVHTLLWAARAPSVERIELEVTANNASAIHLYQSVGFVVEGVKRDALKKGERLIDLVQMAITGHDVRLPKC